MRCRADEGTPEPRLGTRWQPWVQVVTATFRAQREARARERASEAFKSAIVDNALAAIVATDADGRIVEFNPSAESMFGRSRASVLGLPVAEVIVPERYRTGHDAGLQRLREGGPPRMLGKRVEMQALRADGSEFPVEMVPAPGLPGRRARTPASTVRTPRPAPPRAARQRDHPAVRFQRLVDAVPVQAVRQGHGRFRRAGCIQFTGRRLRQHLARSLTTHQ